MMNFNGHIDTGSQFSAGFIDSGLTNFYFTNKSEYEERLDGLDDETRKEVKKHIDEFHTIEEMEMFIQQKTRGRDQLS
ncbi:MAG: hypothetical protein GX129_03305 [Clostridiales bacterium]|jgi:hypothetical protein|nr:hypothetical protein [Clostridiales bacterium]